MKRLRRFLLWLGLGILVLGTAGLVLYWYQRGPGLAREVERLSELVAFRPGMTVADVGAGKGRMAALVARRLGAAGRLYATEIEAGKVEAIRRAAAEDGSGNIIAVHSGPRSTGLSDGCCDVVYMRRVYHHFSDREAMLRGLHAAVRPGGRLAVIDLPSPRWLFFLRHGIRADDLIRHLTSAGFVLERRVDGWSPIDYCVVFRKPAL
jgi:ubiquinone/menaquinone biosynthesis C-methylase UbiE